MPTISLPPRADLTTVAPRPSSQESPGSLTRRAYVMTHRRSLTHELSEGANPTTSPALTLRAEQLTTSHRLEPAL